MNRILFLCGLFYFLSFNGYGQGNYAQQQVNKLNEALQRYEKINADQWMYFSCDSCVSPGQNSSLILLLRQDLLLTGDLSPTNNSISDTLDENLVKALKQYQRRHGLKDDGILGPETLEALNVPISVRLTQLRNNSRYWNKLADTIREPFVLVNIPDYTLSIVENGKVVQSMKVIVGRILNPTPTIYSEIHSVILHPSWVVPYSIATKEIVPMLKNEPDYLNRNHMKVYTYNKGAKMEVNADTINWNTISVKNFNYYFEQVPGKWNALGELKFLFKNEHSVYLHDTPEKYLFSHLKRVYSHGCVRLEKPKELATWLLDTEVNKMLQSGTESTTMVLAQPVPIVIEYFTSWVDDKGLLQFRKDIYNREQTY